MHRLIAVVVLALIPLAGCRPLFRAPAVAPKQPVDDAMVARTMNLDLVSELGAKTIAFEVHWVEGYQPTEFAMDGLREAIRGFAPEKTVEIAVDEAPIPRKEWDASPEGAGGADAWVERHLRTRGGSGQEPIQIHYIPSGRKWFDMGFFGMAGTAAVERPDGGYARVPVIYMATTHIVDASILWLAPKRGERSTLVHEFGHILGLTRVARHAQRVDPIHCTEPQCVMAPPRKRNVLYNVPRGFFTGTIPTWYCKKCMADLQAARAWTIAERKAGRDPLAAVPRGASVGMTYAEIGAFIRRGREAEARDRLHTLLTEVPYHDDYLDLGMLLWGFGWYAEAQRVFESVDANAPHDRRGASFQYVSELLQAQGRYEEALDRLPVIPFHHVRQASLVALGRFDEAVDTARAALAAGHSKEATRALQASLANALAEAGRFDEAIDTLRSSWRDEKPSPGETELEGEFLLLAGRQEEARAAFQRVLDATRKGLDRPSSNYALRFPRARAYAHLGNRNSALEALCGSPHCDPGGWKRGEWAKVLAILGDHDAAMAALIRARNEGAVRRLNPCLDRDLRVLKDDLRFAEFFPCAPKPSK